MAVFIGEIPKRFVKIPDPAERYNELIALFKKKKYKVTKGATSHTSFGKSMYFYLDHKGRFDHLNLGKGLKVRVSDHGVTNINRMRDEFHFSVVPSKKRAELDAMTIAEIDSLLKPKK